MLEEERSASTRPMLKILKRLLMSMKWEKNSFLHRDRKVRGWMMVCKEKIVGRGCEVRELLWWSTDRCTNRQNYLGSKKGKRLP